MIDIIRLPAKPLLIVGGYGYRNAGDEAILAGLLELTGRDEVTVVSRSPAETAATHGVRSIGVAAAPAALLRHRGVVIGGGGLFGRDMGLLGRLLPLAGLAATTGRQVSLLGVGFDRDMPRSTRSLLGALGRRASSVVVRDRESLAILGDLGVAATLAPDLSSRVASAGRDAGMRQLEMAGLQPRRREVVGLCLTAVRPDLVESVGRAVIEATEALPDVDFCLLPMSRHPFVATHNDEVLARRLVSECPRLRVLVPPGETAVVLGIFEAFRAAVCMRYHSLLFAERAGVPIVPFAYAEKCDHWLAERGQAAAPPSAAAIVSVVRGAPHQASA